MLIPLITYEMIEAIWGKTYARTFFVPMREVRY